MPTHEEWMHRAIQLARLSTSCTAPNPNVGAVLVSGNDIIAEDYHKKAGEAHAEAAVLAQINPQLLGNKQDVRMYVTLEPCAHYGRTPPCAVALSNSAIPSIFVGCLDPNPLVAGKGINILKEAGKELHIGIAEEACKDLIRPFFTFYSQNKPYIVLKWAESQDGFMDQNYSAYPITKELTNQYSHFLRRNADAIVVGNVTFLRDRPQLNTRLIHGKNPDIIVLDPSGKVTIRDAAHIIAENTKIYILQRNISEKSTSQIQYVQFDFANFKEEFFQFCLLHVYQNVMVEGGEYTLNQFLHYSMWDEIVRYKSDTVMLKNGTSAPIIPENSELVSIHKIDTDSILLYQNKG